MQVQIRVKSHLNAGWQERLEGLAVVHEPSGTTLPSLEPGESSFPAAGAAILLTGVIDRRCNISPCSGRTV